MYMSIEMNMKFYRPGDDVFIGLLLSSYYVEIYIQRCEKIRIDKHKPLTFQ